MGDHRATLERHGPRTTLCNRFVRWRAAWVWANIPPRSIRKQSFPFSGWVYRQRNLVERFFNRIEQFRGIATRYDRRPDNFLAALKLVSIRIWPADP